MARKAYRQWFKRDELERWLRANCGPAHFQYRLAREAYTVLRATLEGELVGLAYSRQRGERADIGGLYVLYPGEGIGRALLQELESRAQERGCRSARLSTFRLNQPAREFALRQGFTPISYSYRERSLGVMVDSFQRELDSPASADKVPA